MLANSIRHASVWSGEAAGTPHQSNCQGLPLQIARPGRNAPAAPASRSSPNARSKQETGTDRARARQSSRAETPGCRVTQRAALLRQHGKAGRASRGGAALTRSTCSEPGGRQQAAAQRHGEPVPAAASGCSHLRSGTPGRRHLGEAGFRRKGPPSEALPPRSGCCHTEALIPFGRSV